MLRRHMGTNRRLTQTFEFNGYWAINQFDPYGMISTFSLGQFVDATSYAALYDSYKINKITLHLTHTTVSKNTWKNSTYSDIDQEVQPVISWYAYADPNSPPSTPSSVGFFDSLGPGRVKRRVIFDGSSSHAAKYSFKPAVNWVSTRS